MILLFGNICIEHFEKFCLFVFNVVITSKGGEVCISLVNPSCYFGKLRNFLEGAGEPLLCSSLGWINIALIFWLKGREGSFYFTLLHVILKWVSIQHRVKWASDGSRGHRTLLWRWVAFLCFSDGLNICKKHVIFSISCVWRNMGGKTSLSFYWHWGKKKLLCF